MQNDSAKTNLIGGSTAVLMGLIAAFLIYAHPDKLRAPPWVVYLVAAGFVTVGLGLLAAGFEMLWLQRLLGIAFVSSLLIVFGWIALGPGERNCSMSMPFFETIAPDTVCRSGFGIGAMFTAILLGALVVRTVRSR